MIKLAKKGGLISTLFWILIGIVIGSYVTYSLLI
jgi:hypothetical protein